ncbi:MAG TPA: SPW repeat protein [Candidatus Paceibacterota bacterium]|jgi:hypothetical protein|nr:SPW repeat protein [Candidatus Paceibacterota bacterium]
MWQQWVNFILGLWIIVSAYAGMTGAALTTNLLVVGVLVAILALWGALQAGSHERHLHEGHYKST